MSQVLRLKQLRVRILDSLNIVYPSALLVRYLYRCLLAVESTYDLQCLAKDLGYLQAKGYLAYVDEPLGVDEFGRRSVRLTAPGKEVADQVVRDPALEI